MKYKRPEDLQRSIMALRPAFTLLILLTVLNRALEWFDKNQQPDLIFSDIQLGDGLVFDIFKRVDIQCPVVFCTAYDQYAIQAFRNNGIDYLLKPLEEGLLEKCLDKLQHLLKKPASQEERPLLTALLKELQGTHKSYKSTFLVTYRDKLIPVNINDVLFFRVAGEVVDLCTKDNQQYRMVDSLDYIESHY